MTAPPPKRAGPTNRSDRARREQGKPKGGSPKAAQTEERRDALHAAIRQHGLSNLDVKAFAKAHRTTPKTVYEDLKLFSIEVGERGAETIVLSALENIRRAKSEFLDILKESKETRIGPDGEDVPKVSDSVRLGAAKALMESAKHEIDSLQRLGYMKGEAAPLGSRDNPLSVDSVLPKAVLQDPELAKLLTKALERASAEES